MSRIKAPQKAVNEILVETLTQTATLARYLAELLNQVARLAGVINTHQAKLNAEHPNAGCQKPYNSVC